ncbi:antitoxin ParD1/3/4 [Rhizobium sp. BK275]|uniref:type II toxin-antitoxin system ParD family antitoxin n=1 Tax=unclassified Rhizobium TaxID=2613769 RepID=UPI0016230DD7|nr:MULTISPECIES: type II toxin-antitoxin system ParD family antitoxin [unclassified Rhizobium]MBB3392467.1 antitoxin ParD1/3/4 [Rhizobium sp. BK275]MBB3408712.1 antitoxin ParD1/3/4 [Rhizobium sp. BK316]
MNVSIGERWEKFVEQAVKDGRYGSASEVVREGLRLVEEREAKLNALRREIGEAITAGGEITEEELQASLDEVEAELAKEGY